MEINVSSLALRRMGMVVGSGEDLKINLPGTLFCYVGLKRLLLDNSMNSTLNYPTNNFVGLLVDFRFNDSKAAE